jgi:hypothetical protein
MSKKLMARSNGNERVSGNIPTNRIEAFPEELKRFQAETMQILVR